jgi:hypothetical protein
MNGIAEEMKDKFGFVGKVQNTNRELCMANGMTTGDCLQNGSFGFEKICYFT